MAIITITLTAQGPYFISGIPRAVALETNIPSIIFYTLDGSTPSYESDVYLEPITLPTDSNSVRLRVLAINGTDSGTLDVNFGTDNMHLYFPRRSQIVGGVGIVVDGYGIPVLVIDGYSVDAYNCLTQVARRSDYELEDLDIRYSTTGPDGYGLGNMIRLGPYPPEFWQDDAVDSRASSPNNNNVFFNPRSLYIVIDGRTKDGYDGYSNEAVYPINRPFGGSMPPTKFMNGEMLLNRNSFTTGGLINRFINYGNGTIVFYYFDFYELRWIKSIQSFDINRIPERIGDLRQSGPPLVFKWIYGRRSFLI